MTCSVTGAMAGHGSPVVMWQKDRIFVYEDE